MSEFEFQPLLQNETLSMRPMKADDFEALYAVASDPLIWELHPYSTRYQRPVFEKYFEDGMKSGGAMIALDAIGKIAGSSRFYEFKDDPVGIAIGYTFLGRGYWGGSFNGAMKRLMLDHAFRFVNDVYFEIGEKNLRSRRAIEKVGGVLCPLKCPDEKPHVVYRIGVRQLR